MTQVLLLVVDINCKCYQVAKCPGPFLTHCQYNKWMFSKDHLNFHFPLFTTCVHMLVQFGLAATVLYFVPRFRPGHNISSEENSNNTDTIRDTGPRKPLMTKQFYITRIGPCGAATGLDIGLGNMSLKFISLTFYSTSSRFVFE